MTRTTKRAALASALTLFLAFAAGAAIAKQKTLNELAIDRLNKDTQELWDQDGVALIKDKATSELKKLIGTPHPVGKHATATITNIAGVTLDIPTAPGVTCLTQTRVEGAVPLSGHWNIGAAVDVHVKGKVLGIKVDRTYRVSVELDKLRATLRSDLDASDPVQPKIVKIHRPKVDFKLKIKTSSWVMNCLLWLNRPLLNGVAHVVVMVGGNRLAKKVTLEAKDQPKIYNSAGGPGLAPVAPLNLEDLAIKLETDIQKHRMPWGTVFEMFYDKDFTGTWQESLDDPSFDPGNRDLVSAGPQGDSAHMTGHLLAGYAFRHALTRSPEALAHARAILKNQRILLTMKGTPGDLNRSICPMRPDIQLDATSYSKVWNGTEYWMSDYISRDAYMGTIFGLSTAHTFLDDPADKAEAAALLQLAVDYLVKNKWTWRKKDGSIGERWQGVMDHQYAWVLAAHATDPVKYRALHDEYKSYAELSWISVWSGMGDPYGSYYGFNLLNGAIYTALRLEKDPVRFQRAYLGQAIMRRYIGHHQNAHFNNAYGAIDASSRPALKAENEILLNRWMRQPRRFMIGDLTNDPTIEKITIELPFDKSAPNTGGAPVKQVTLAKYPIPVDKRLSTGFRWSRGPFRLADDYINGPEPRKEGEGVDFVLPYWMARYYGLVK